ncbi:MAG: glycogen synthase [Brevefilum sp.]|nr:glycogen synthase [Brevefilum sp.]
MTINVLFLAAEAEPFVKVGGLGDVAGALPEAIHRISEKFPPSERVDIRMVLPYHFAIKGKAFKTTLLGEFDVQGSEKDIPCQVYQYDGGAFPVYFLDGDPIDEKSPVYSLDPINDGYKYIFFSLAALQLPGFLDWRLDILHANDWHTAAAIYALNIRPKPSQHLVATKTLHTLHNLPFMGYGTQQALTDYGLPPTNNPVLPEWARHAPLPLGLLYADKIVAVSPHYAEEILTPEFGCALETFLKTRKSALTGIINGLDTEIWDPENDPLITQNFSRQTLSKRIENKRHLQSQFNLANNDRIPLLTLVSRMDPQKGIDIALRGLAYCEDQSWQAIILGTGTPFVEDMARQLETKYPDRVRSVIDYDNALAHQLYAGADLFLMPSRYEPCGLSQMISMRYGCIPLARATGGLADTIQNISRTVNGGTGFLFSKPYPSAFAQALKRALRYFYKPDQWAEIQLNGMQIDFTWENSAQKYVDLYKDLIKKN